MSMQNNSSITGRFCFSISFFNPVFKESFTKQIFRCWRVQKNFSTITIKYSSLLSTARAERQLRHACIFTCDLKLEWSWSIEKIQFDRQCHGPWSLEQSELPTERAKSQIASQATGIVQRSEQNSCVRQQRRLLPDWLIVFIGFAPKFTRGEKRVAGKHVFIVLGGKAINF